MYSSQEFILLWTLHSTVTKTNPLPCNQSGNTIKTMSRSGFIEVTEVRLHFYSVMLWSCLMFGGGHYNVLRCSYACQFDDFKQVWSFIDNWRSVGDIHEIWYCSCILCCSSSHSDVKEIHKVWSSWNNMLKLSIGELVVASSIGFLEHASYNGIDLQLLQWVTWMDRDAAVNYAVYKNLGWFWVSSTLACVATDPV